VGYFEHGDEGFHPLPFAQSQWAPNSINGSALAGLIAHALEKDCGAGSYRPARFTMDIFRQPEFAPIQTRGSVVREGRSIRIADVHVYQGDRTVARASMVSVTPTREPVGARWRPVSPSMSLDERVAEALPQPGILWGSDEHPDGWSVPMPEHQNASRKRLWFDQPSLFDDVDNTPLIRAAMLGELTNTLTSWGDRGVGFINHDATILLARMPIGNVVGIEADNHLSADGIAAGAATMWDCQGAFGMSMVGAIAHSAGSLDASSGPDDWQEADSSHRASFDAVE
jgi:hypothetical protein